jgi:predicted aspartyl protease
MTMLAWFGPALLLAVADPAPPPPPAPPPSSGTPERLQYGADADARMTVLVNVAGRGPYRFIVDTGAERTVLSEELARQLALPDPGRAILRSTTDTQEVETVRVPSLEVGRRSLRDLRVPLLLRENIGAEGMLGIDSLQSQNVTFDFVARELTLSPSAPLEPRRPDRHAPENEVIVVTARSRLGRLILADAAVGGQRVQVIVDTGASITIGNEALRRRLIRGGRELEDQGRAELLSVTGGRFDVERRLVRRLRIGGITINHLQIGFTDPPIFEQLGLRDRPALLLGMDALRLFDRISIDFPRRRVTFELPTSILYRQDVRMAASAPATRLH